MSGEIFTNLAETTLSGAIGAGATSLTVADGSDFPSPGAGEYFMCILVKKATGAHELIKVTARTSNSFDTVVRAQEGSSAIAFDDGDIVEHRPTAASFTRRASKDDIQQDGPNFVVAGGSADVITVTFDPVPTALADGHRASVQIASDNAGPVTLNPNSLGANNIKHLDGSWLAPNDLKAGMIADFRYELGATTWYLCNPAPGSIAFLSRGQIDGLEVTFNATDPDHDLDISVGQARSDSDDKAARLSSAITKQMDAAFAAGDAAGGLGDTVSLPTDGTLHVFLIQNTSTGAVDVMGDTDVAGSNVPSGWEVIRRIASRPTDASGNLKKVRQFGDLSEYDTPQIGDEIKGPSTSATLETLKVPSGIVLEAQITIMMNPDGREFAYITSPDQADVAPVDDDNDPVWNLTSDHTIDRWTSFDRILRTNSSGQIRYRFASTDPQTRLRFQVNGWWDRRGRE